MVKKYLVTVQTQTPDQAGTFLETFIYSITQSWEKIIKTCSIEKQVKEFLLILKIPISIVKFTIREHLFSVITSLRLVGLVTEELLEALPMFFACQNLQKFRECAQNCIFSLLPKIHHLT